MPDDLKALSAAELAALRTELEQQGAAVVNKDNHTADDLKTLATLKGYLTSLSARETEVATEAAEMQATIAEFNAMLTPPAAPEAPAAPAAAPAPAEAAPAAELVTAGAGRGTTPAEDLLRTPSLNVSLRQASRREQILERQRARQDDFIITASANVHGLQMGTQFSDRDMLAQALQDTARNMGATHLGGKGADYRPVASIKNQFAYTLGRDSTQQEIEDALKVLTDPRQLYSMDDEGAIDTAGGGFCSPSLRRYDFFNMTCEDGAIDLPTMGIERGGTTFPTSPSLADVYTGEFTSGTNPWLWTETDDIATVTGAPNKPCVRVPCPEFVDVRLECYGICLTAGNLTDSAYPEATRNQIRLLMSAMYHASNARYIQQMVALASTLVTGGTAGSGWVTPTLSMLELWAEDYRTRYGMCRTDVLEVVLPHWWLGGARADLSARTGVELISVTDSWLADRFDERYLRVQFVSDWQVRTTGLPGFSATSPTAWPTSVEFLMYAAGTVVRGNGMSLNLGVVRDSVLNAENDHTALWTEECHLIAKVGHEIKRGSILLCADGTTGAADLTICR
jgi:hypothetical protein